MNIVIREARPTDAAAIVRLIHELAQTAGENSPIAEAYVEKYFASPLGTILLAEKQHEVIGLLSYSLRPDLYHAGNTCLIEELVVREAARGHGVGGALLTDLLSRLEAVRMRRSVRDDDVDKHRSDRVLQEARIDRRGRIP